MKFALRLGTLVLLVMLTSACATRVPAPSVEQAPALSPQAAYDIWDGVLNRFVDRRGRVDFAALADDRAALDRFVAWVYRVGPDSHPERFADRDAVLAYHINAYNALAMYNVLESGIPERLGFLARVRFFALRKVQVGGRPISLLDYENDVIRPLEEPRIHFALNCMVVACPTLPREPFRADTLEARLEREAHAFFADPKHLRVDDEARVVHVSEILDFYTGDFTRPAGSLIAYINRYRDPDIPGDYEVRFIDYDWTVNKQP